MSEETVVTVETPTPEPETVAEQAADAVETVVEAAVELAGVIADASDTSHDRDAILAAIAEHDARVAVRFESLEARISAFGIGIVSAVEDIVEEELEDAVDDVEDIVDEIPESEPVPAEVPVESEPGGPEKRERKRKWI